MLSRPLVPVWPSCDDWRSRHVSRPPVEPTDARQKKTAFCVRIDNARHDRRLLFRPAIARAEPPQSTWKIGTPIVTAWDTPTLTDAVANQIVEGGWNLVLCQEAQLDVAKRHGLRAMLNDALVRPEAFANPAQRAKLDALIDRVKNHPAMYSYFIVDEPAADKFPVLGKLVAYLRQRNPRTWRISICCRPTARTGNSARRGRNSRRTINICGCSSQKCGQGC